MRQRLPRDGLGVLVVGLGSAPPAAPLGGAVGLDLPGVVASRSESENQRPAEESRPLNPDPVDDQLAINEEAQQLTDASLIDRERLASTSTATAVDHGHRRGVLVRVDPGHPMHLQPSSLLSVSPIVRNGGARRRQIWVESCRLSSSQAPCPAAQAAGPTIRIHDNRSASIAFRVRAGRFQLWPGKQRPTQAGKYNTQIAFEMVLAEVRIDRVGPGRPRTRPDWVLADKAYSSKANRDHLARRGIKAAIPIKDDQAAGRRKKGSAGGRPPDFDKRRDPRPQHRRAGG